MEISLSSEIIRKSYAISINLDLPYSEVKSMNQTDRNYLYEIVKNSLETNRNPMHVLSANYNMCKASLYITKKDNGNTISTEGFEISDVINQIESDAVYDTFSLINNKYNFEEDNFYILSHDHVYIKHDEKIKISKKDLIFLKNFNSMYEVIKNTVIDAFELGGKYNMLKIKKYGKKKSRQ